MVDDRFALVTLIFYHPLLQVPEGQSLGSLPLLLGALTGLRGGRALCTVSVGVKPVFARCLRPLWHRPLWKAGADGFDLRGACAFPAQGFHGAAVIGIMPICHLLPFLNRRAHMYQLGHLRKRPRQEKRQDDEVQSW